MLYVKLMKTLDEIIDCLDYNIQLEKVMLRHHLYEIKAKTYYMLH